MINDMEAMPAEEVTTTLQGPATEPWILLSLAQQGGDLMTRHSRRANESKVKPGTAAIYEHKANSQALQLAILEDPFNVMKLASFELLLCRP